MHIDMKKIDENLYAQEITSSKDFITYSVKKAPVRLYGVYRPSDDDFIKRMPNETAERVGEGHVFMNGMTSGVRARFKTDAEKIQLHVIFPSLVPVTFNVSLLGTKGFDVYIKNNEGKEKYYKSFRIPLSIEGGYESELDLPKGLKDITLYFPLYNQVRDVFLSIPNGSVLLSADEYTYKKPIVFFGSSITQGCCASRTGNSYPNIISRMLDTDIINLGISGGAKGQLPVAEYIGSIDASALVYDYDHNAPDAEFLEKTHAPFFEKVRKMQPDLPVIMISKPDEHDSEREKRRDIILKTYENAIKKGDKNVYFIDGYTLFEGEFGDTASADGIHPNDYGYLLMAQKIGALLQKILFTDRLKK